MTHKKALPATAGMHAPVFLAVFSIRLGVASRKTALPCVLLARRPYRRSLLAPPERAFVQAPGVWFLNMAFLTGAVPSQFSSPANDVPRGLPSLSVVPNPSGGFFHSNRRRCPSLCHIRAKAIYPCRSTILLRTAGGATGRYFQTLCLRNPKSDAADRTTGQGRSQFGPYAITSSSWPGRRQKTAGSHRTESQHSQCNRRV